MKITRSIIEDLLPVYLAGEASAATRALVEEWLEGDPELARLVEESRRVQIPPTASPPPTLEKLALDRTRRLLRWRMILLGTAVYVTSLPLSVTFNRSGFEYGGLLIDNWPERIVVIAIAIGLWLYWWRLGRRTRVTEA